jgi:hypothetical protein
MRCQPHGDATGDGPTGAAAHPRGHAWSVVVSVEKQLQLLPCVTQNSPVRTRGRVE